MDGIVWGEKQRREGGRNIVWTASGFAAVGSGGEIYELYMRSSTYQYWSGIW